VVYCDGSEKKEEKFMKKKTAKLTAAFLALLLAFAAFPAVSAAGYTASLL